MKTPENKGFCRVLLLPKIKPKTASGELVECPQEVPNNSCECPTANNRVIPNWDTQCAFHQVVRQSPKIEDQSSKNKCNEPDTVAHRRGTGLEILDRLEPILNIPSALILADNLLNILWFYPLVCGKHGILAIFLTRGNIEEV